MFHKGEIVEAATEDIQLLDALGIGAVAESSSKSLLATGVKAGELLQRLHAIDFTELAQVIAMWVERINTNISRRSLLFKLSSALAVAAAAPIFDMTEADDRDRVRRALDDPSRIDPATLAHTEEILRSLRRQGDVLGPDMALRTAMAQRDVMARVAKVGPSELRPWALSILAEITQLIGWLLFNLGDYRAAQHYYDDARSAAHDAKNNDLVTYIICTMSHLATWQGKPRVGIDHAIAAGAWANKSGSTAARAYAADVAARAYAADRQPDECLEALEQEQAALDSLDSGEATAPWWYFYDASFYWATRSGCALQLNRPDEALDAVTRSLTMFDPANLHNYAFTLLFRGEAYLQKEDVAEACLTIGDVARLTTVSSAVRIDDRISGLRTRLDKWKRTKTVRQLDQRLLAYSHTAASIGNGNTNK